MAGYTYMEAFTEVFGECRASNEKESEALGRVSKLLKFKSSTISKNCNNSSETETMV